MSERLLIDTHVWLWASGASARLAPDVRRRLVECDVLYVSTVSIWEVAIKDATGKLHLPEPVDRWVPTRLAVLGARELPFHSTQAIRVASLPTVHRDPFDRALVAVAQTEDLPLVTADRTITEYPVETVWAG